MSDGMKIGLAVVGVGIVAFFVASKSKGVPSAGRPAPDAGNLWGAIPAVASAWASFTGGQSKDPGSSSFVPYAPGQTGLGPLAPAPVTYGIDPTTGAASPGSPYYGPPSPNPTTYGIDPDTGASLPGSDFYGPPVPVSMTSGNGLL